MAETKANGDLFFEEEHGGQMMIPLQPPQPSSSTNDEFIALQNAINLRRNMLLDKQQQISQIKEQNHFLGQVKKDYMKYNSYIISDKIRQIEAMKMLTEYLETLKAQGTLSAENMKDALHEQDRIKTELETISSNLDDLMGNLGGDGDSDDGDSIASADLYDVPA